MINICRAVFAAALLAGPLAACSRSGKGGGGGDPSPPADGPAPPAANTLSVDLSVSPGGLDLETASGLAGHLTDTTPVHNTAYLQASDEIGAVSTDLAAPLALPVQILRAAVATTAQQAPDGTWVRSFEVGQSGKTWTVNLIATDLGDGASSWSMRLTTKIVDINGCCTDFEAATGNATHPPGSGTWSVNDLTAPAQLSRLFDVVYAVTAADQKTLTFSVGPNRPTNERLGGGSIVAYQAAGDTMTLTVQDASIPVGEVTIAWSQAAKSGSFLANDGTKSCWDTASNQYADVACP